MSIPKKIQVACPKCSKEFKTVIYESINTDYSPDIAESVINGKLFEATCPACGFVAHLEYDILYNDLKHDTWIWVLHPNNKDYHSKVSEIRTTHYPLEFNTRIVSDMNELREKVACLEAGVDDRVVELCKRFFALSIISQNPDFQIKNAYFSCTNKKPVVTFYNNDGGEAYCYLEKDIYEKMAKLFEKPLQEMKPEPFMIIDAKWADDFFQYLPEEEHEEKTPGRQVVSQETKTEQLPTERANKPQILYCRKCGAKLLPDSIFCNSCGTRIAGENPALTTNTNNAYENWENNKRSISHEESHRDDNSIEDNDDRSTFSRIWLPMLALFLVVLIVAGANGGLTGFNYSLAAGMYNLGTWFAFQLPAQLFAYATCKWFVINKGKLDIHIWINYTIWAVIAALIAAN